MTGLNHLQVTHQPGQEARTKQLEDSACAFGSSTDCGTHYRSVKVKSRDLSSQDLAPTDEIFNCLHSVAVYVPNFHMPPRSAWRSHKTLPPACNVKRANMIPLDRLGRTTEIASYEQSTADNPQPGSSLSLVCSSQTT